MLPGGSGIICMMKYMLPELGLHYGDAAQPLTTGDEELDDPDHSLSDLFEVCKHKW